MGNKASFEHVENNMQKMGINAEIQAMFDKFDSDKSGVLYVGNKTYN